MVFWQDEMIKVLDKAMERDEMKRALQNNSPNAQSHARRLNAMKQERAIEKQRERMIPSGVNFNQLNAKMTESKTSNSGGVLALGALAVVGIGAAALMKKVLSDDKGKDKTNSSTAPVLCKESVSDTATNCPICNARILNGEKTCNVCGFQL